jgi:hypothetical protein
LPPRYPRYGADMWRQAGSVGEFGWDGAFSTYFGLTATSSCAACY